MGRKGLDVADETSRTKLGEVTGAVGYLERTIGEMRDDMRDVKASLGGMREDLTEVKAATRRIDAIEGRLHDVETAVSKLQLSQAKAAGVLTAVGTIGGGAGAALAKLLGGF